MQTNQEITQLIREMDIKLRKKYVHILDAQIPFQSSVSKVISTDGIYYAESNWERNLIIITQNGVFIPFPIILSNKWSEYDDQPYSKFLEGIVNIASVVKYNEEMSETLKLINNIIKAGEIACFYRDQLWFSFSKYGYRWV